MGSHFHANKHPPDNREGSGCKPSFLKSISQLSGCVVWVSITCTGSVIMARIWGKSSRAIHSKDSGLISVHHKDMDQLVPINLFHLHRKKQDSQDLRPHILDCHDRGQIFSKVLGWEPLECTGKKCKESWVRRGCSRSLSTEV